MVGNLDTRTDVQLASGWKLYTTDINFLIISSHDILMQIQFFSWIEVIRAHNIVFEFITCSYLFHSYLSPCRDKLIEAMKA